MWSFITGSNCAISSTSFKKLPFEGEWSISECPLNAIFRTASDCTIATSLVSTALHRLCSASKRAFSFLSMVVTCFNQTANSFHDAKLFRCSGLFSWLFRAALAFFQSDSPPFVKVFSFGEKSWQQKQKRLFFFFEYVNQLLLILSPFTKILLKYWWWQLLPSSLLGKMKSDITWFGPLRTNSVFIVSVRCAGQSAGSVGNGSSVFAASGRHTKSTLSHLMCAITSHTHTSLLL